MIIHEVQFVFGAALARQLPEPGWPEIAVAGRSNVGKSALINLLLARRRMVRVSNSPGRTRQVNFFAVNQAFYLVDLPGYGFAKAPREVRRSWQQLIIGYVQDRPSLKAALLLVDVRRIPNHEDVAAFELFQEQGVPVVLAITKADKLPPQQRKKQVAALTGALNLDMSDAVITSAEQGWGRDELWNLLECFLAPAPAAGPGE